MIVLRPQQGCEFAYSGRSLRRISSAATSSTPASANPGSAPWRTRAFDQRLCRPLRR
jgi:hypothetical protein